MRKCCLLVVLAAALPAYAMTWDFNDLTAQGWTLVVGPGSNGLYGGAAIVTENPDANSGVSLGWGTPVNGLDEPSDGSGCLGLLDGGYATMNVPSTNSFVFAADLAGKAMNVNKLFAAGLGYRATHNYDTTDPNTLAPPDAVTAWFEGRSPTSERMVFKDSYADGNFTDTNMKWLKAAAPTDVTDYNVVQTARATIYYNWEDGAGPGEAGKVVITWEPLDYVSKDGNSPSTFVYGPNLHVNAATGQIEEVNMIRVGGAYSWSQCHVDNVTFIPEPASLALLGLGALPLLRRRR